MTFSTEDKLKSLRREIALRKSAYPKWIGSGRMTEEVAEREIAVMDSILADYERLQGAETSCVGAIIRTEDLHRLRTIENASKEIALEVRTGGAPSLGAVSALLAALNEKEALT